MASFQVSGGSRHSDDPDQESNGTNTRWSHVNCHKDTMILWKHRRGVILLLGGVAIALLYILYTGAAFAGDTASHFKSKSHLKSTFHDHENDASADKLAADEENEAPIPVGKDAIIFVIGDSHIAHLNDAISQEVMKNAQPDFETNHKVVVFGMPGATVDTLRTSEKLIYSLKSDRPELVYLHIGGNDADSKMAVDEISGNILKYSIELEMVYGVKSVILSEQFHRKKTRNLPPKEYDLKIIELNKQLRFHDHTRFWSHNQLMQAKEEILGEDGVHLNDYGQSYFYNSIKSGLNYLLKLHK